MNGLLIWIVLVGCLVAGMESRAPGVVDHLAVCAGMIDRAVHEKLLERLQAAQ